MDPKTRNGNGTKTGSRGSLMETGSGGAGGTLRCPTLTMSPLIHLGKVKIFTEYYSDQSLPKTIGWRNGNGTVKIFTQKSLPLIHLGKMKIFRPDQYSPKNKEEWKW